MVALSVKKVLKQIMKLAVLSQYITFGKVRVICILENIADPKLILIQM